MLNYIYNPQLNSTKDEGTELYNLYLAIIYLLNNKIIY